MWPSNPWRQVAYGATALVAVLVGGTVAYSMLGLGVFDAFYQTLITISTVGYEEIGEEVGTGYRLVSSVVILVGVGVGLYTLGAVFEAIVEGRLSERVGRARLQRAIDQLSGHTVVCGFGQVGQSIARMVLAEGVDVVVVDRRDDLPRLFDGLSVVGEATDDETLRKAGVPRARALVVALDSDADNMYVTLAGRSLNPELLIVSRTNDASAEPKMRQAGADRVVNPHEIGGTRMAGFVLQPNVADFLGEAMHDEKLEVRLREFTVSADSRLAGATIGDSGIGPATGVTVLAIRRSDTTFSHDIDGDTRMESGDVLIALGTAIQHEALRRWLSAPSLRS